jgi:hypothetical protein
VAKLRAAAHGLQEALRRLEQSNRTDQAVRAEWTHASDEAVREAWDGAKAMTFDLLTDWMDRRLESQLSEADAEVRRAVDLLAGETDPGRREQLHAAVKLLDAQRQDIRQAQALIVARTRDAETLIDTVHWSVTSADDPALERATEGIYRLMDTLLGDATVQRALRIGPGYGQFLTSARSILDSSHQISVEVVTLVRLGQLDRNSTEYLRAIDQLKQKMESTMRQIHTVEGWLREKRR